MQEDSRLWLDYIGKLNDRALNHQRASGATTWAVSGVIALLVAKMVAGLPAITQSMQSGLLYLTAFAGVADTLLFGLLLMMFLASMGSPSGEVRLQSRLDRTSKPLVFVALCASLLVFGAANIAVVQFGPRTLHRWPFWVLGTALVLNAVSYPASRLRTILKHRRYYSDLPEPSQPAGTHTKRQRAVFFAGVLIFLTICLAISAVPVIQALPRITAGAHVDALLWVLYAAGAIFLLLFVCFRLTRSSYDRFLTSLERRIVIENLTADAIRSEFVREYLGEDLREWLSRGEKHLNKLHEAFERAAAAAEAGLAEVSKIDRDMKFEIEGRRKAICDTLAKALRAYTDYAAKLSDQVKHLASQRAVEATPDLLNRILDDWERQLETILPRYRSICEVCKKLPGSDKQAEQCAPPLQEPRCADS